MLEREAILARQTVNQLLRETTLRIREDVGRHVTELRPRTSGEWSEFLQYSEETDRYGEAFAIAIRNGLAPPNPPPRLIFQRALFPDPPAPRPVTVNHHISHRVQEDSGSSSDEQTANRSSEYEDDPDQWGGVPPPLSFYKSVSS